MFLVALFMKTTQTPINGRIDRYMINGTLRSKENKQSITTSKNMDESYKHNIEQRRPESKEYMLRGSVFIKYQTRQN